MATMIVKHRVADFGQWKQVFNELHDARMRHGWTHHEIFRDAADPQTVVIVNHMKDLNQAKAYGSSDELKAGMQRAGVISAPEILFYNDEEVSVY
jgi:hypothetical protein